MFAWQQTQPSIPTCCLAGNHVGIWMERSMVYRVSYTLNKQQVITSYSSRPRKLEVKGTVFLHQKAAPGIYSIGENKRTLP